MSSLKATILASLHRSSSSAPVKSSVSPAILLRSTSVLFSYYMYVHEVSRTDLLDRVVVHIEPTISLIKQRQVKKDLPKTQKTKYLTTGH